MLCAGVSTRATGESVNHWSAGDVLLEVQRYVKARVIECEECIFTASGQADSPEEPEAAETGAALKSLPPLILLITFLSCVCCMVLPRILLANTHVWSKSTSPWLSLTAQSPSFCEEM